MIPTLSRWLPSTRAVLVFALILGLVALVPSVGFSQEEGAAPPPANQIKAQPNIFIHVISSVGVFWIVLLPLSIALIALCVLLFLDLRMVSAIPPGFVEEFTDTVNRRNFKGAYDMARSDPSYLGRVLTAGMSRLQYGLEDAREASLNTLDALKSDKDQKNNYTAMIATLGPLLGLVGTVFGMIMAFIELSAGGAVQAAKLADGISHALAVTLIGVAISVPAIVFNTYFRNRITQVMMEVGNVSDDLLTQMYHNSKKAGGAPAGPAMAAAAAPVGAAPAATTTGRPVQ